MPELAIYITKVFISLGAVYLFYRSFLQGLTFYKLNRWYLVGYSFLSFFIPLINISQVIQEKQWSGVAVIEVIPAIINNSDKTELVTSSVPVSTWDAWDYILTIYLAGVCIMLVRFFLQWLSFLAIKRKATLIASDPFPLYHVNENIIPFSIGRSIYINPGLHGHHELEQILQHEYVHARERHTIDILWAELLCVFCWCNPFAWLTRHCIRQNLEFIADQKVVNNGIQKKDYQYMLLKVLGSQKFNIATPFNYTSLKNRIIMMNKIKSQKLQAVKFVFILPLLLVLLLAFRDTIKSSNGITQNKSMTISGLVVDANTYKPLANVSYQESALKIKGSTDGNGYFIVKISNPSYPFKINLVFVKEGYENIESKVELNNRNDIAEKSFLEYIGMSSAKEHESFIHTTSTPERNGKENNYEMVLKKFEEVKRSRENENTVEKLSAGSEKPYWVVNGHTYLITAGGSTASVDAITDIVMVDGKRMTGKEVNERFTKGMIKIIAAADKEAALKKYGINQEVMEIYISSKPLPDSTQNR